MLRMMLFDLDGVLRRFPPAESAAIEAAHGFPPGALARAAFQPALLEPTIRGERSRADWVHLLGEAVGDPAAAAAFLGQRGEVDAEVLALADALPIPTGLLTNATDTLAEELAAVGLAGRFSAVLSSSALGAIKPEPAIYARACAALQLPASQIGFVDDSARNVEAARAAGMAAVRFTGAAALRRWLAAAC